MNSRLDGTGRVATERIKEVIDTDGVLEITVPWSNSDRRISQRVRPLTYEEPAFAGDPGTVSGHLEYDVDVRMVFPETRVTDAFPND